MTKLTSVLRNGKDDGPDDVDDAAGEEVSLWRGVGHVVRQGEVGGIVGSVEKLSLADESLD